MSAWEVKKKMGNSRFSDGFLIGLLVGGAAVFLLGTKKGKDILKTLTEQGLEGLGEIAKDLENEAKKETKIQLKRVEEKIGDFEESIEVESSGSGYEEIVRPQVKRFFRKTPAKN